MWLVCVSSWYFKFEECFPMHVRMLRRYTGNLTISVYVICITREIKGHARNLHIPCNLPLHGNWWTFISLLIYAFFFCVTIYSSIFHERRILCVWCKLGERGYWTFFLCIILFENTLNKSFNCFSFRTTSEYSFVIWSTFELPFFFGRWR